MINSPTPSLNKVRAIVFDLDDTLIPSSQVYRIALRESEIDEAAYAEGRRQTKDRLGVSHVSARNRLLYIKNSLQFLGNTRASSILSQMERYETSLFNLSGHFWKHLNRSELINALHGRFKLGILTNENARTQLIKIASFAPSDTLFSAIVTSEEVGVEKPDVKMFETVYQELNCSPRECLMIGDNINSDLLPAVSLGSKAIWTREFVENESEVSWKGPVIDRLDELGMLLMQ